MPSLMLPLMLLLLEPLSLTLLFQQLLDEMEPLLMLQFLNSPLFLELQQNLFSRVLLKIKPFEHLQSSHVHRWKVQERHDW